MREIIWFIEVFNKLDFIVESTKINFYSSGGLSTNEDIH